MLLLQEPLLSRFDDCSYLPDRKWRFEYFFATDVTKDELDILFASGWRKFGTYFFKPDCVDCYKCVPLRVLTSEFKLSKSQRRILKKGGDIHVKFKPLEYSDEIYEIYRDHSLHRFNRNSDKNEFLSSFYMKSCPSLQSEYYLHDELIAVGFLDVAKDALSSVYFIYKTEYQNYRLGTLSVIQEMEYAANNGYTYYYLGYYVEECQRMTYKNQFHPHEKYDWHQGQWFSEDTYSLKP